MRYNDELSVQSHDRSAGRNLPFVEEWLLQLGYCRVHQGPQGVKVVAVGKSVGQDRTHHGQFLSEVTRPLVKWSSRREVIGSSAPTDREPRLQ
jgi:hypothetical protein